jgi:UDP-N-acetyl-2-amino-2-deoxyglucuronate dehydrogenase
VSERLRVAVVGCGAISQMHLLGMREGAPRTDVVAAVDLDAARAGELAARTGAQAYGSLDEALAARGFDAVLLLLPHALHEQAALRCFAAGKHVLLEKPMAPDPEACARILEAARRAGTVFMVGENAQYWPEVVTVRDLLAAGAIGDVVTARASIFFPPLASYYGGESPWRFDLAAAGGGIAVDTGSHWIRPLRMWLGELDEVVAALGRPLAAMEGESLVRALLRFRSGVVASFDALLSGAPLAPELLFRITGSTGEITIDGLGRVLVYDGADRKGRPAAEPQGYMKSYAGELRDFECAVLDGAALAAGPEEALGELRAALAMYRSARSGRWEKVWD